MGKLKIRPVWYNTSVMSEDVILKKLNEHDDRFDQHDRQFDIIASRFDATDKRFDAIDQRFSAHDHQFDMVANRFDAADKRFDAIEMELHDFKDQMYTTQDQILTIVQRLDEEKVFSAAWVQRIEREVDKIKAHLKLS